MTDKQLLYAPRAAASQPQQPRTVVDGYEIGLINAMHPTQGRTVVYPAMDGHAPGTRGMSCH